MCSALLRRRQHALLLLLLVVQAGRRARGGAIAGVHTPQKVALAVHMRRRGLRMHGLLLAQLARGRLLLVVLLRLRLHGRMLLRGRMRVRGRELLHLLLAGEAEHTARAAGVVAAAEGGEGVLRMRGAGWVEVGHLLRPATGVRAVLHAGGGGHGGLVALLHEEVLLLLHHERELGLVLLLLLRGLRLMLLLLLRRLRLLLVRGLGLLHLLLLGSIRLLCMAALPLHSAWGHPSGHLEPSRSQTPVAPINQQEQQRGCSKATPGLQP